MAIIWQNLDPSSTLTDGVLTLKNIDADSYVVVVGIEDVVTGIITPITGTPEFPLQFSTSTSTGSNVTKAYVDNADDTLQNQLNNFHITVVEQDLTSNSPTSVPSIAAVKNALNNSTIDDTTLVHKTGNETINGDKTFTNSLITTSNTIGPRGVTIKQFSDDAASAVMQFKKSRGSDINQTNVVKGDLISYLLYSALINGSYTVDRAGIGSFVTDNGGIGIGFMTGTSDSNYKPSLRVDENGNVSIGDFGNIIPYSLDYVQEKLEVRGNIKAAKFMGDGSLLTNLPNSADVNKAYVDAADTNLQTQITTNTNSLSNKVAKVSGKDLSTNDYTTAEKTKLSGLSQLTVEQTLTSGSTTNVPSVAAVKAALPAYGNVTTFNSSGTPTYYSNLVNALAAAPPIISLAATTYSGLSTTLVVKGKLELRIPPGAIFTYQTINIVPTTNNVDITINGGGTLYTNITFTGNNDVRLTLNNVTHYGTIRQLADSSTPDNAVQNKITLNNVNGNSYDQPYAYIRATTRTINGDAIPLVVEANNSNLGGYGIVNITDTVANGNILKFTNSNLSAPTNDLFTYPTDSTDITFNQVTYDGNLFPYVTDTTNLMFLGMPAANASSSITIEQNLISNSSTSVPSIAAVVDATGSLQTQITTQINTLDTNLFGRNLIVWKANLVMKKGDWFTRLGLMYAAAADLTTSNSFDASQFVSVGPRPYIAYEQEIVAITNVQALANRRAYVFGSQASVSCSLPVTGQDPTNFYGILFGIRNNGAVAVTLSFSAGTVDGSTSLALQPSEWREIYQIPNPTDTTVFVTQRQGGLNFSPAFVSLDTRNTIINFAESCWSANELLYSYVPTGSSLQMEFIASSANGKNYFYKCLYASNDTDGTKISWVRLIR